MFILLSAKTGHTIPVIQIIWRACIKLHNKGNGAKYLRGKAPVELVYAKEYKYYKNALHAERKIKKLRLQQKQALIKTYEQTQKSR